MKDFSEYTKKELIEFIRLYNDLVRIKNYHQMKKSDLIKIINEKFIINDKGEIIVKNDLKTSTKKSLKVIKLSKKKTEDLSESELYKLLGSLRGDKDKLLDEIKELKEDIQIEKDEDEPNVNKINNYELEIENRNPKVTQLKQEINKTIDLIKKLRERDEFKQNDKKKDKKEENKKAILAALTKKYQEGQQKL